MEAKVDEIADGVYRISAYVPDIAPPAGFTFNHFLVLGDEPLLFHTGLRRMFPIVRAGVEKVLPAEKLRWICFGHYEADGSPSRRTQRSCMGQPAILSPSTTWPTERHAFWRMARLSSSAGTSASATSTRRIFRTDGTRASCTKKARARCFAATSSPSSATGPP